MRRPAASSTTASAARPRRSLTAEPHGNRAGGTGSGSAPYELRDVDMAVDDVVGYFAEAPIVAPGVPPERLEGLVHVEAGSFRQDTLGLLDDHSAVQGQLQL